MATLILGTIGRIVAGPVVGILGTLLGSGIDRAVIGSRGREHGRTSNLAIQSATYGEAIPLIVGRMRAAGNLIWTSGIREAAATTGGGKGQGASTSFSYSASFAVGLAGLRIAGVDRIWADGKLLRDAAGAFAIPITMRVYTGDPDQAIDPLIAANEGAGMTPAYRGLGYVVFEDMPLGEFGNRIPNLTFEIVGESNSQTAEPLGTGEVIRSLAAAAGHHALPVVGVYPALSGYLAGSAGSLADALAPLLVVSDAAVVSDGGLRIVGPGGVPIVIESEALDARLPGDSRPAERQRRAAADSRPASLELAFYDTSRDYQPGLQRARRSDAARIEHQSIAAAMHPTEAKALAMQLLASGQTAMVQRRARLPWRFADIVPGVLVRFADEPTVWRVREARLENFIVHLELERRMVGDDVVPVARAADGGRALLSENQPAGPTTLQVLDLPLMAGEQLETPRLWIAGNGSEAGWRRAGVLVSVDAGDSFVVAGTLEGGTAIGLALTTLPNANSWGWDAFSTLDVELISDRDWLEPRSKLAVLDGANLALVGDELIQFCNAEVIGPRRFRLSGLLRGRRGTEASVSSHVAGERFVLIDQARMLRFDPPLDLLGEGGLVRATGNGDRDAIALPFRVAGAALRPLSPAHLRATPSGGDIVFDWVRRSRTGFAWTDFVDAPLGETDERYEVEISLDGRLARTIQVVKPSYRYSALDRLADGGGTAVVVRVAQWSSAVGPGASETIAITI